MTARGRVVSNQDMIAGLRSLAGAALLVAPYNRANPPNRAFYSSLTLVSADASAVGSVGGSPSARSASGLTGSPVVESLGSCGTTGILAGILEHKTPASRKFSLTCLLVTASQPRKASSGWASSIAHPSICFIGPAA